MLISGRWYNWNNVLLSNWWPILGGLMSERAYNRDFTLLVQYVHICYIRIPFLEDRNLLRF